MFIDVDQTLDFQLTKQRDERPAHTLRIFFLVQDTGAGHRLNLWGGHPDLSWLDTITGSKM